MNDEGHQAQFIKLVHTLTGHSGSVYSISCDQHHLYSSAGDRIVTRWDLTSGAQDSFVVKLDHPSYAIHTNNDSSYIYIACMDGTVHCVDKTIKKLIFSLNIGKHKVFCLKEVITDKSLLLINEVGSVIIINVEEKSITHNINLIHSKVRRFVIHGDEIIVADGNGKVTFIDSTSLQINKSIQISNDALTSVYFDDLNSHIFLGTKGAHLKSINLLSHKVVFDIPAHNYVIYDLIKIGEYGISCSRDKTIKIWNQNFTKVLQRIDNKSVGHKFSVNQLLKIDEFSFASCSDDCTIKVFRLNESS